MSRELITMVLNKNIESSFKENLTEVCYGNYAPRHVKENFDRDIPRVPIQPAASDWQVVYDQEDQQSLKKLYVMHSAKHVLFFVNELIKKAEYLNHHPQLTIDHYEVTVQLTTKDLGEVTELDKELSMYCDELYEDVVYINS